MPDCPHGKVKMMKSEYAPAVLRRKQGRFWLFALLLVLIYLGGLLPPSPPSALQASGTVDVTVSVVNEEVPEGSWYGALPGSGMRLTVPDDSDALQVLDLFVDINGYTAM